MAWERFLILTDVFTENVYVTSLYKTAANLWKVSNAKIGFRLPNTSAVTTTTTTTTSSSSSTAANITSIF